MTSGVHPRGSAGPRGPIVRATAGEQSHGRKETRTYTHADELCITAHDEVTQWIDINNATSGKHTGNPLLATSEEIEANTARTSRAVGASRLKPSLGAGRLHACSG